MRHICFIHLSSLKPKHLQVSITVSTCFYHGYCSSQSNVPGPCLLSLNSREVSTSLLEQDRRFVCPRLLVHPPSTLPNLLQLHVHPALRFKPQSLWGRSHMAPSGKDFNPLPVDISQETHMELRGNNLFHIHLP